MYRFESVDLGGYRGENYLLVGFVEPQPQAGVDYAPDEDAEEYGITLVRTSAHPLVDNIEIVRMDTAHGQPHMDRLYLPPDSDENQKVWLGDDYTYARMKAYLLANWKAFVDLYIHHNE